MSTTYIKPSLLKIDISTKHDYDIKFQFFLIMQNLLQQKNSILLTHCKLKKQLKKYAILKKFSNICFQILKFKYCDLLVLCNLQYNINAIINIKHY